MKISTFLVVKAVISLFFGAGFVFMPAAVMSIYGTTLNPSGALMGQLVGACLVGIGLICWFDRKAKPEALQAITLSLFIADTIGFLVCLIGQISGLMSALGWMVVAIWLFLALGLGYFRFLKK